MSRDERERQLLEVAERLWAERGWHAVSMDEIAERAGITKPVLYDHFGSKEGLLAACIARIREELEAEMDAAMAEATGGEQLLWNGLRAYFRFIAEHSNAWVILLAESALTGRAAQEVEAIRRQRAEVMTALAAEELGGDQHRARVFAEALIGACERLAVWRRNEAPDMSPDELGARLMEVVWVGLDRLRDGERWIPAVASDSALGETG